MPHSISLVAVGDLQLGDSPTTVGYGFFSRYRQADLAGLFDDVRPLLGRADILFGNLETTLVPPAPGEVRRSELQMRGEPAFASALRRAGFTVLNVANNHATQHGDAAFEETVAIVEAEGIACCGVRGTDGWGSRPVLLQSGSIGLLAYCMRPRQYSRHTPPYAEGNAESICQDVRRLRATGVTVVVSLHWGEEFVAVPSSGEIAIGHAIADAGAALIIGHHPHVTRPVERYGDAVIAHSLGNFIGDMVWYPPFRRGAVFRCSIENGVVAHASTIATRLGGDFRPRAAGEPSSEPVPTDAIGALGEVDYATAIAGTWRQQRAASYLAAILNVRRTPLPILRQLLAATLRNKVDSLVRRSSRSNE